MNKAIGVVGILVGYGCFKYGVKGVIRTTFRKVFDDFTKAAIDAMDRAAALSTTDGPSNAE